MIFVIFLSRRIHVNPDNVATPIAASLGDITTLGLLAYIARFLYSGTGKNLLHIFVSVGISSLNVILLYIFRTILDSDCSYGILRFDFANLGLRGV